MHIAVDVDQDALGGEPLCAMAGDGIAMIEMGHSLRIERDGLVTFGYPDREAVFALIASMIPISRLATPKSLLGAVNCSRSPAAKESSTSR